MPRPMPDGPGKRYPLSSRLTHDTHNALREAARLSGRSVSQEAEFRLEQSFVVEQHEEDAKGNLIAQAIEGDEDTAKLIRTIAAAIGAVCAYTEKKWQTDTYTRYGIEAAALAVVRSTFNSKGIPSEHQVQDVDGVWLEKVQKTGQFMGQMLAAPRNPEFTAWISHMADAARASEGDKSKMIAKAD